MNTSKIRSIVVLLGFTMAAFGANAQQQQPPQQQPPQQPPGGAAQSPAEPVDEETVEQFATAYAEVQTIQEDFTQRLQNADDREQAQSLQQEAQEEMLAAVEENGISVQEYNELIARMDQDPELRQQVFDIVNS